MYPFITCLLFPEITCSNDISCTLCINTKYMNIVKFQIYEYSKIYFQSNLLFFSKSFTGFAQFFSATFFFFNFVLSTANSLLIRNVDTEYMVGKVAIHSKCVQHEYPTVKIYCHHFRMVEI